MKKNLFVFFVFVLIASACNGVSSAQTIIGGEQPAVPRVLGYQGVLLEKNNRPKPDGIYIFKFGLCDTADCSDPKFPLGTDTLLVKNGGFSTMLTVPNAVKFNENWWLHIEVSTLGGQMEALGPNMLLSTAAYSFQSDDSRRAHKADTAALALVADTAHRAVSAHFADNGVPIGSVVAYAGNTIPRGWLLCDGKPYSIDVDTTKALFNAIGFTWGGSGKTFNVPDMRGMFLRGVDTSGKVDPDGSSRLLAGGLQGAKLGSVEQDATKMPNSAFAAQPAGGHNHTINWHYQQVLLGNGGVAGLLLPGGGEPTTSVPDHTHVITGGDLETRPKNVYVYYIIKASQTTTIDY